PDVHTGHCTVDGQGVARTGRTGRFRPRSTRRGHRRRRLGRRRRLRRGVPGRRTGERAPVTVYTEALRRAATGAQTALDLVDPAGGAAVKRLHPTDWCGPLRAGDAALVDRCTGPTLDVGCGPGRLAGALV